MLNQQIYKKKKKKVGTVFFQTTLKPVPVPYKNGSEKRSN